MTADNANAVNLQDESRRYLYIETTSYYSCNSEALFKLNLVFQPKALRVI